jgi:diguanylate cyclase (GGDEF)-like protein
MAVVQLVVAVLLGRGLLHVPPGAVTVPLPWWALAIGFAATESFVFHIQIAREAQTVSISELPLVLGLFFASPLQLLVGRLVGTVVILLVHRRSSVLKTAWNGSLVCLLVVVAEQLFRLISPGAQVSSLLGWLAAFAAVLGANVLGSVALSCVVAVYEGGLNLRSVAREAVTGDPAAPLVVTLSLIAAICLDDTPRSLALLLLTGVGLLLAYRGYAALADRHLNLERLYRFTQAVSSSPELDEVLGNVLREATDLLRAESAEIIFVASSSGAVARIRVTGTGRLTRSEAPASPEDEWLLETAVSHGESLLLPRTTRDADQRSWLAASSAREAVAVPLRGGAGTIGVLVVTDRMGEVRTFEPDDVLLLETVANHASVALQNGELIDRLRHEAVHDALTGLPNRTFVQRRLTAALEDVAAGRSTGVAVLILDLDGFKEVNDTLGHQQGDHLLVEVAARLTTAVGAAGTVSRLGGDEFAVLLTGSGDEDGALRVGRRVLRALEHPVALDGMEVEVGGSVGIALAPAHASDTAALLKRADLAMYSAKASTSGIRVYEPELDTTNPRRLTLVAELRTALQSGQLEVHVQPQARLSDGAVVSGEALVRWLHPERGLVTPDEFIPVAERSGLIAPLTSRVLELSVRAIADWRAAGHDLGLAVNLSTRSLHDADLVEEVTRLLGRYDVPADRLTLEVTEGSVMADPARATALLHQLRDLGVRLSVDDFGTGYSSLSYLKRLPVHEVKIDRSFVANLGERADDVAIVRAIVDLGRHLGLEVVAEGVEDQETWDLLASMGCHLVQGWHLARAMPADDLVPWLHARAAQSPRAARLRAV